MRVNPSVLFIYGLSLTIMAFALRELSALAVLALINLTMGVLLGGRKYRSLLLAFAVSLIGVWVNALVFAGGEPLLTVGPLVVRSGAVKGFLEVSLKLSLLLSATLIFSSLTSPRDLLKSLESELGLPKQLSFMVSLSLRLLRIFEKDLAEIQLIRRSRGLRPIPLTPGEWASLISPLLSIGLERGKWVGVAAELRGFSLRKIERTRINLHSADVALLALLVAEIVLALYIHLNPLDVSFK
ncbi:MAG: hypothetical protein DRJ63_07310 [Thermoprotei archaeon]|nr:MAG: hypothetical protein DRJ63_07310 [Thermoprotei archaeon]